MRQSKGLLTTNKNSISYKEPTWSEFGNFSTASEKWNSGVLAPNGKIYCGPANGSRDILVIDPENRTTYQLPSPDNPDYTGIPMYGGEGGVLAPNGKIYFGTPKHALVVDPSTDTTELIVGSGGGPTPVLTSEGTIVSFDEGLYWCKGLYILDPNTGIKTTNSSTINNGTRYNKPIILEDDTIFVYQKEIGRVSALNYFPNKSYKNNPLQAAVDYIGTPDHAQFLYEYQISPGVLGPDETLYYPLSTANKIFKYDVRSDTAELFDSQANIDDGSWYGGALAPNGRIYYAPGAGTGGTSAQFLEVDPLGKTARGFGAFSPVATYWKHKWATLVLAANGKLYGVPAAATSVLEIDVSAPPPEGSVGSEYWTLPGYPENKLDPRSRFFNHF